LRRNAVIAIGNSGDTRFAPTLEKLAQDKDLIVAEHAKWALNRLKESSDTCEDSPAANRTPSLPASQT
jgi:epoxyqueuosine reductase